MTYDVDVRRVPAIATAVIRRRVHKGELSRVVPECCGLVWSALRARGLRGGRNMALYRECGAVVEAGVELQGGFTPDGEIVISQLPAGLAASVVHYGPYAALGGAHNAVQHWCRLNGYAVGDACWEIYGHWQKDWDDDPSRIRTDVFYELSAESRQDVR